MKNHHPFLNEYMHVWTRTDCSYSYSYEIDPLIMHATSVQLQELAVLCLLSVVLLVPFDIQHMCTVMYSMMVIDYTYMAKGLFKLGQKYMYMFYCCCNIHTIRWNCTL